MGVDLAGCASWSAALVDRQARVAHADDPSDPVALHHDVHGAAGRRAGTVHDDRASDDQPLERAFALGAGRGGGDELGLGAGTREGWSWSGRRRQENEGGDGAKERRGGSTSGHGASLRCESRNRVGWGAAALPQASHAIVVEDHVSEQGRGLISGRAGGLPLGWRILASAARAWASSPSMRARAAASRAASSSSGPLARRNQVGRRRNEEDGQSAGEARRPAGGQRVVGADSVVAEHFRRVLADEDGAVRVQRLGPPLRPPSVDLQVLRGQLLAAPQRVLFGSDDGEAVPQRGRGGRGGGERRQLARQLLVDAGSQRLRSGDQNRERVVVVLGLGQQVGGDQGRVPPSSDSTTSSDGPASKSIPTTPDSSSLAGGHPLVSGAGDDVATGRRRDSVRHGGHCLGAAHCQQPVHPSHRRRRHRLPGGVRRRHPDFAHACRAGRHRRHQDRRRKWEASPWGVAARHSHGHQRVARRSAQHLRANGRSRLQLGLRELLDPARRPLQDEAIRGRQGGERDGHLLLRSEHRRARRQAVPALGALPQRCAAAVPDLGDDLRDPGEEVLRHRRRAGAWGVGRRDPPQERSRRLSGRDAHRNSLAAPLGADTFLRLIFFRRRSISRSTSAHVAPSRASAADRK